MTNKKLIAFVILICIFLTDFVLADSITCFNTGQCVGGGDPYKWINGDETGRPCKKTYDASCKDIFITFQGCNLGSGGNPGY